MRLLRSTLAALIAILLLHGVPALAQSADEPAPQVTIDKSKLLVQPRGSGEEALRTRFIDDPALWIQEEQRVYYRALREAFAAQSTHAGIAFLLGWAERGNGAMVNAVSAFRNAAVLDPAMVPAHLALADTYLQMQQPALAVQALERGLSAVPGAVELRRLLESIKR